MNRYKIEDRITLDSNTEDIRVKLDNDKKYSNQLNIDKNNDLKISSSIHVPRDDF